jgi:hypothetical protein
MENLFNSVKYKTVIYKNNPEFGYYEKQPQRVPFNKLPFELKVERTQLEKLKSQGAEQVICSRKKNGKYLFFTGLQKTCELNSFLGNDYTHIKDVKKNSIVVFSFSEGDKILTVYYFNLFYKDYPEERIRFVNDFLSFLKSK